MDKAKAVKVIIECAKEYKRNLENKNFLFIVANKSRPCGFWEATFLPRHFYHLTGVKKNNMQIASSVEFYTRCVSNALTLNDFCMAPDGTTALKLCVLPSLMQIQKCTKMMANYNGSKINLRTDILAGSTVACMGFIKDKNYYMPNTVLKTDLRTFSACPLYRVVAIFSKTTQEEKYRYRRYLAKDILLEDLVNVNGVRDAVDVFNCEITP